MQISRSSVLVALLGVFGAVAGPAPIAAQGGSDPSPTAPADGCAETVAARVQTHYEGVQDLSASIVQTSQNVAFGGALGDDEPARGEVVFAKPGRMRWSYETPDPSLVVSNGKTLWIYDPGTNEVQELPVGDGFLSGTAIQFLLGEGRILESFTATARDCAGAQPTLLLSPREPATYEHLELRVEAATGAIRETTVVDLFGNRTHVAFSKVRRNSRPAASLFEFEAPDGARVMKLSPPPG